MLIFVINSYTVEIKSQPNLELSKLPGFYVEAIKLQKQTYRQVNILPCYSTEMLFQNRMDLTSFETLHVTQILLLMMNSNPTVFAKA